MQIARRYRVRCKREVKSLNIYRLCCASPVERTLLIAMVPCNFRFFFILLRFIISLKYIIQFDVNLALNNVSFFPALVSMLYHPFSSVPRNYFPFSYTYQLKRWRRKRGKNANFLWIFDFIRIIICERVCKQMRTCKISANFSLATWLMHIN